MRLLTPLGTTEVSLNRPKAASVVLSQPWSLRAVRRICHDYLFAGSILPAWHAPRILDAAGRRGPRRVGQASGLAWIVRGNPGGSPPQARSHEYRVERVHPSMSQTPISAACRPLRNAVFPNNFRRSSGHASGGIRDSTRHRDHCIGYRQRRDNAQGLSRVITETDRSSRRFFARPSDRWCRPGYCFSYSCRTSAADSAL